MGTVVKGPQFGGERSGWRPESEGDKRLVKTQLEKLLSDPHFSASKRYPILLRFMVEKTLAGEEDSLKERTLGIEVFRRAPDYDTNLDPVVRLCAAEVRKRIAQYYQSPVHANELRIELNPGSYVPIFSRLSEGMPDNASDVAPPPSPPEPATGTKSRSLRVFLAGLSAVVILVVSIAYWNQRHLGKNGSALDEVWAPLLTSNRNILICIGESDMNAGQSVPAEAAGEPDDDSMLQAYIDKRDFVPFPDVQALSRFVQLLGSRGHEFSVQSSSKTVYFQLRETPVLLLGAFNNHWTMSRTARLRFSFVRPSGPIQKNSIKDARSPDQNSWQVDASVPRSEVNQDYAIIARFKDEDIGQTVIVAGGLSGGGSRAAAEFLTDEGDLKDLLSRAPSGWDRRTRNFEAVISSPVVRGMQGKPKIVAVEFW